MDEGNETIHITVPFATSTLKNAPKLLPTKTLLFTIVGDDVEGSATVAVVDVEVVVEVEVVVVVVLSSACSTHSLRHIRLPLNASKAVRLLDAKTTISPETVGPDLINESAVWVHNTAPVDALIQNSSPS